MADAAPVVHIGENSPEKVAFKLMEMMMNVENRSAYGGGDNAIDREWILRTYAQCIRAVKAPQMINDVLKEYAPPVPPRVR